jgi:hypothetical protein
MALSGTAEMLVASAGPAAVVVCASLAALLLRFSSTRSLKDFSLCQKRDTQARAFDCLAQMCCFHAVCMLSRYHMRCALTDLPVCILDYLEDVQANMRLAVSSQHWFRHKRKLLCSGVCCV